MKVAIIKYNSGNIQSVIYALEKLGVETVYTDDPQAIQNSDKVVFPGQGEASSAMKYLQNKGLDKVIKDLTQPVLGICLGQQLFCRSTEEGEDTKCLDLIPVEVKKFNKEPLKLTLSQEQEDLNSEVETYQNFKIPQIGWNSIYNLKSKLFKDIAENSFVYFIHSYYCLPNEFSIASCSYINNFSAAIKKDNFYATQFHPEKSGDVGSKILENFLKL
jgi:imidazole glycerol-phosphate synthase subunit HisH